MTNPNNAVGTNGAFGGRTSVNAFNDVMGAFQGRGLLSGWGIVPSSGMTVDVGGSGTVRDTAVAEDNAGNKTSINNISGSAISVTLNTAPASNSRYDAIVAYVDKPPMGNATQDNPECCGIIPVTGTAASTPSYPDDGAIRSAITADGASGSTAYYVVLGYVLVASGTTTITSGMITAGSMANVGANQVNSTSIQDNAIVTNKINNSAVTSDKIDFESIKYPDQSAIIIGTYVDAQNNTHHIYKRYVQVGGWNIGANGGFMEKNLNLQSYTIMHTSGILYRSDVATVMSILPGGEFSMVWTNSGQTLRIVNHLASAQVNAILQLAIVYRD